jgi:CheY-like chemotaxis protein
MILTCDESDTCTAKTETRPLVLVAEDEALVREATVRFLRREGYDPIAVEDGQEAVDVFQARAHEISIVLLDVLMPRVTGRQAYEVIRQLRPDVRVIFCTGYDPAEARMRTLAQRHVPVLEKPFSRDELLRALAQTELPQRRSGQTMEHNEL